MLAHLACADAVERHRPVTLEASLDSMGRESYSTAAAHLDSFEAFERMLDAGQLTNAKRHLAQMSPDLRARQYNAAGLLSLLEGNLASATSLLRRAAGEPFGPATLAIQKNLYWLAYRDPENADDNERIDSAWSAVMSAFERSHDGGMESKDVSMFDVGIQRRICNHAMYDRNRHAAMWEGVSEAERWRMQYLELVKKAVTNYLHRDLTEEFRDSSEAASTACSEDPEGCESDWQIGQGAGRVDGPYAQKRLGGLVHIELLLQDVLDSEVEGDVIEAGCFMGGTAVFMRAVLEQKSGAQRRLLVADSFEGIPAPRTARGLRVDGPGVAHGTADWPERYSAGQARVRSTFRRYGLWDERVVLIPGFFNISLPSYFEGAPLGSLALIHIDADAYESVLDALDTLYPRLSPGGHVIIDDFHLPAVRTAVHEYRDAQGVSEIEEPLLLVRSHVENKATRLWPEWCAQAPPARGGT